MFENFKKQVEELGKKFGAELYSFSYNNDGNDEVESDWDVKLSYINDKFEEGWTIIDLITLHSALGSKRKGTVHVYEKENKDYYHNFFKIKFIDNDLQSEEVEVSLIQYGERCEGNKKFNIVMKRKDIKTIRSWQELIERVYYIHHMK